ncbi:MAG: bacteriochlorophyll 4-vinyl reductase [Pseudomonadota bacterium]
MPTCAGPQHNGKLAVEIVSRRHRDEPDASDTALVGPNAVIQIANALDDLGLTRMKQGVFAEAGLWRYLANPPSAMIPESEAIALHQALFRSVRADTANAIATSAGVRTADYVIANRMPGPVKVLLRLLPKEVARRMLAKSVTDHAWTFCGSGEVSSTSDSGKTEITIHNNKLASPGCAWHLAVFERLFRRLVDDKLRVTHTSCEAYGSLACRFLVAAADARDISNTAVNARESESRSIETFTDDPKTVDV